jgi:SET domain-containing protein
VSKTSKPTSKATPKATSKPSSKSLVEVRQSPIQGSGVFAARRLKKGQRIIEYTGERINDEEAYTRYDDDSMERHHTFLFALDDDLSIDGAAGGNESRFINHSCDPNCEAWIEKGNRIFIYAKKDIAQGTELTYDYAYVGVDPNDPAVLKMYVCHCGSPKCRGSIVVPPKRKKSRASSERKEKDKDDERRTRRMAS